MNRSDLLREAAERVVNADMRASSDDPSIAEEGEYEMSDALDALRAALQHPAHPERPAPAYRDRRNAVSGVDTVDLRARSPEPGIHGGYSWECPSCGAMVTTWTKPPALSIPDPEPE